MAGSNSFYDGTITCSTVSGKVVCHAGNILVIDGSRIVQSSTYQQLMQQGDIYRRFMESRELAVG